MGLLATVHSIFLLSAGIQAFTQNSFSSERSSVISLQQTKGIFVPTLPNPFADLRNEEALNFVEESKPFDPSPEGLVRQAKKLLAAELGLADPSLLDDAQFEWIGPYVDRPLDKTSYLAAGRFFSVTTAFPDLNFRAHDFRIDNQDPSTVRLTCRTTGTMRGELRLREETLPATGNILQCPPEAVSIKFDMDTGKALKIASGFCMDRAVGNTDSTTGVIAASIVAGKPVSDWEIFPPFTVIGRFFGRPEPPVEEATNFLAPFPETVMVQLAKGILTSKMASEDPSLLSEDFVFSAAFEGPVGKKKFLEKYAFQEFDGVTPRFSNFRVDPYDPRRVWVDVKPVAPGYVGAPQAMSFSFDDDGFCTRITSWYVLDPTIGNGGGLGGPTGLKFARGSANELAARPLPRILGRIKNNFFDIFRRPAGKIAEPGIQFSMPSLSLKPTIPSAPAERPRAREQKEKTKQLSAPLQNLRSQFGTVNLLKMQQETKSSKSERSAKPAGELTAKLNQLSKTLKIPQPKQQQPGRQDQVSTAKQRAAEASERKRRQLEAEKQRKMEQAQQERVAAKKAAEIKARAAAEASERKRRQLEAEKQRKAEQAQQERAAAKKAAEIKARAAAEAKLKMQEQKLAAARAKKQQIEQQTQLVAKNEAERKAKLAQAAKERAKAQEEKLAAIQAKKQEEAQRKEARVAQEEERSAEEARKQAEASRRQAQAVQREEARAKLAADRLDAERDRENRKKRKEAEAAANRAVREAEREAKALAKQVERERKQREMEERRKEEEEKRQRAAEAKALKMRQAAQEQEAKQRKVEAEINRRRERARREKQARKEEKVLQSLSASAPLSTFRLLGFGSSENEDSSDMKPAPSPSQSSRKKAPRGVPTLSQWRKNFDGSISGRISGSGSFPNGERITTSPISSGSLESGEVVVTGSGSKYFLEYSSGGLLGTGGGRQAEKSIQKKKEKAVLDALSKTPTVTTIRLFGFGDGEEKNTQTTPASSSTKPVKSAPRGVPTLRRWKRNLDGTISGSISGSRSFGDGERVTTSPIKSGSISSGEVVMTGSGSRYFLA